MWYFCILVEIPILTLIYLLCLFLKVVWEAAILGYLEINLVIFENFPKGNKDIFRTN